VSKVSSGLTSTSLDRAPAPRTNFVRGKSSYVAYKPGGLDDVLDGSQSNRSLHEASPLPPGLSRRMHFPGEKLAEDLIQSDVEGSDEPEGEVCDTQLEVFARNGLAVLFSLPGIGPGRFNASRTMAIQQPNH
jgi:hypothetical protein